MNGIVPLGSTAIEKRQSRYAGRALARIDSQVDVGLAEIEAKAELQAAQVMAVAYVGRRGLHEIAMISQLEGQLATLVPLATSRLQAIGDLVALGVAEVVADTVRRVSR
jgi:hypothetical protein